MAKEGKTRLPGIQRNDPVTKSKFDNLYGCREILVDSIKRATRRDDRRQGSRWCAATAMWARVRTPGAARPVGAGVGARDRSDRALQASMEGYRVVTMDMRRTRPIYSSRRPAIFTSSPTIH